MTPVEMCKRHPSRKAGRWRGYCDDCRAVRMRRHKEAQAKLTEAGLCVACKRPFKRDQAKAHWKRPQLRCSDCCLAKKTRASKVAS